MSEGEREIRIQLAACYRIFDYLGWTELIFNHITVKLPGDDNHFLINPYGLHYSEICASNLVKMDIDGNIVEETPYSVNPAGIVIHTAIHAARKDAICNIFQKLQNYLADLLKSLQNFAKNRKICKILRNFRIFTKKVMIFAKIADFLQIFENLAR